MRAACLDIGSNTTRLLIADCDGARLVALHQERAFTRLGHGLRETGRIADEKIGEVVAVIEEQLARAREHGVTELRGVATAAARTASNGAELLAAIAGATGLEVEVLSEAEEARLAFVGATGMMEEVVDGALGVIDVGGGSSEIIVGRAPDRIAWWASVAVGSGALADDHLRSDPPTQAELAGARAEVDRALTPHRPPRPGAAVAVGGSATSLARVAGPVLDAGALRRALAVLASRPAAAVARGFEIDPERARLLPAGLLILEAAAERLDATLTVGRGGIREGVLLEAARGDRPGRPAMGGRPGRPAGR